jgi:RHS repeat-associated protein
MVVFTCQLLARHRQPPDCTMGFQTSAAHRLPKSAIGCAPLDFARDKLARFSAVNDNYTSSGTTSLSHVYNGFDDRVSTTATPSGGSADTRRFVYAPDGRVIGEYGASATDVRAEFIWMSPQVGVSGLYGGDDGLGGYMPLAVAVQTPTPGVTALNWVHANHMGVPIHYSDATGIQIPAPTGYSVPGFPGQSQTLPDLYYNRYRDYDTTTGRYIQADPIGLAGGDNPYLYAKGNPVRYMDPLGLNPVAAALPLCFTPIGAVACIGGAAVLVYIGYEWSVHKPYNPLGPNACYFHGNRGNWGSGGGGFAGNPPRDNDEPEDECEIQFDTDIGRCTKARIQYGKAGFKQCASSALRRKTQCEKGQQLEPLTGVDRPLYRD